MSSAERNQFTILNVVERCIYQHANLSCDVMMEVDPEVIWVIVQFKRVNVVNDARSQARK